MYLTYLRQRHRHVDCRGMVAVVVFVVIGVGGVSVLFVGSVVFDVVDLLWSFS